MLSIDDKRLREFLLDSSLVDQKTVENVFERSQEQNVKFSDLLLHEDIVSEQELQKLTAHILGVPFVDLEKKMINPETLQIIPEAIAKKYNIVAFEKKDKELKVAMLHPEDLQTIDFVSKKSGLRIIPCFTTKASVQVALKQYEKSLQVEFGDIITTDSEAVSDENGEELEKVAQDVPVIRIVDTLLKHAILEQASDIHIEPTEKEVIVRYRIDGILHDAMNLPKKVMQGIVARIKVLSNLKLDEHRLPQDGRFKIETDEYKIAFRVSVLPVFDGEKVVMRLLDESSKGLTLEAVGFIGRDLEVIDRLIHKPNGIILVTGPTGSGKTTTLYTAMDILNSPEVNISTVEDPVEYRMKRINQTQVNTKIGMTFAAALRSLLRQDPDIIMVGEIRDEETMEIALHAAMTGHLVLSTLHTNSAAASIPRLLDMGAEPFLVASTVNGIVAQRLVRKLCQDCKKERKLTHKEIESMGQDIDVEGVLAYIKKTISREKKPIHSWEDISFYTPKGCDRCGDKGFRGRLGIFEVLEMTDELQKKVSERGATKILEDIARKEGMHSMVEDGILKAAQGLTSLEEIFRVTQE
jgi:type IV pilus assembly protein PilB